MVQKNPNRYEWKMPEAPSAPAESLSIGNETISISLLPVVEVDNRVVVPANTHIHDLVTSADVAHSWAVPSSYGVQVTGLPQNVDPYYGLPLFNEAPSDTTPSIPSVPIQKNFSEESSIHNRILRLEGEGSIFLLEKPIGDYWREIKTALDQADFQRVYNGLLECENRDLEIREQKHECYCLFQRVLSEHPGLAEGRAPHEALLDFFSNTREELEFEEGFSVADTDRAEVAIYKKVIQDIRHNGPQSYYIKQILGHFDE
ncbi:hypothetical protein Dimus_037200 [Dionaea muscipula]